MLSISKYYKYFVRNIPSGVDTGNIELLGGTSCPLSDETADRRYLN
jgi:hypothetical protein